MELSQSQKAAVYSEWKNKVTLVLSTAGSGKTLALTCRAVHIATDLVRQNKTNSRVLCICFNVSAADDMTQRITNLVQKSDCCDKIFVTRHDIQAMGMVSIEVRTFHALGYWILRSANGDELQTVGLKEGTIKVLSDKAHLNVVTEALKEAKLLSSSLQKSQNKKLLSVYEKNFCQYKRSVLENESHHYLSHRYGEPCQQPSTRLSNPKAFQFYQQRMQEQNGITYDDMIGKPVALLRNKGRIHKQISSRYEAVLVDEFQDLTAAEFVLCKAFVENSKALTMVGDDDQHIYSFRSSKPFHSHKKLREWFHQNINILLLPENRRCPGAVVQSATAVITRNLDRVPKDISAVRPVGNPVRIVGCENQSLEIKFMVERIKSLLPTVRKRKQQILVLFRTTELLNTFQKQLHLGNAATTRVLIEPGAGDRIVSKTTATFALICLMSRKIDRATFLWAVVTVSDLPGEFVESILDSSKSDEQVEQNEPSTAVGSSCHENSKRLREDGSMAPKLCEIDNPYSSQYLETLTAWYRSNRSSEVDQNLPKIFQSLHCLLEKTDELSLKLGNLDSADEVVRSAEEIISATSPGDNDDYVQYSQDETTDMASDRIAGGKEGFDLLVSAARRIDQNAREEWEEAREGLKDAAATNSKEKRKKTDDAREDFLAPFGMGKRRVKKRRGNEGTDSSISARTAMERQRMMGRKIDEFCETILVSMTRSDGSESTKLSRSERPLTVLSTIHKAKGTSCAFVFLCGANKKNLPLGRYPHASAKIREERRLFFVSMTRTMTEFTCTYSPEGDYKGSISDWRSMFIDELLDGIGDSKELATEWLVREKRDVLATVDKLQKASAETQSTSKCRTGNDGSVSLDFDGPGSPSSSLVQF